MTIFGAVLNNHDGLSSVATECSISTANDYSFIEWVNLPPIWCSRSGLYRTRCNDRVPIVPVTMPYGTCVFRSVSPDKNSVIIKICAWQNWKLRRRGTSVNSILIIYLNFAYDQSASASLIESALHLLLSKSHSSHLTFSSGFFLHLPTLWTILSVGK